MTKQIENGTVWHLRRGMDRRFRQGHPWVYSNEILESPKGLQPGAPIELRDSTGKFLARGYGNPQSLIAFRVLTRNPDVTHPTSKESLVQVLKQASALRSELGLGEGGRFYSRSQRRKRVSGCRAGRRRHPDSDASGGDQRVRELPAVNDWLDQRRPEVLGHRQLCFNGADWPSRFPSHHLEPIPHSYFERHFDHPASRSPGGRLWHGSDTGPACYRSRSGSLGDREVHGLGSFVGWSSELEVYPHFSG